MSPSPWSPSPASGPARTYDDDTRLSLEAALALLAPRQRSVLVLRYYEA